LGRALRSPVVKMDRCDIEAIKGKAAHLELLENMLRQASPTDYGGIYMLNNAIAWAKEKDVVAEAEAMRRTTGCDFTPVRELDKLAENMRIINRYIRGETTGLEGWVK